MKPSVRITGTPTLRGAGEGPGGTVLGSGSLPAAARADRNIAVRGRRAAGEAS